MGLTLRAGAWPHQTATGDLPGRRRGARVGDRPPPGAPTDTTRRRARPRTARPRGGCRRTRPAWARTSARTARCSPSPLAPLDDTVALVARLVAALSGRLHALLVAVLQPEHAEHQAHPGQGERQ